MKDVDLFKGYFKALTDSKLRSIFRKLSIANLLRFPTLKLNHYFCKKSYYINVVVNGLNFTFDNHIHIAKIVLNKISKVVNNTNLDIYFLC